LWVRTQSKSICDGPTAPDSRLALTPPSRLLPGDAPQLPVTATSAEAMAKLGIPPLANSAWSASVAPDKVPV